jgi:hemolysin-activating ACP:hemolysin acyltransferase
MRARSGAWGIFQADWKSVQRCWSVNVMAGLGHSIHVCAAEQIKTSMPTRVGMTMNDRLPLIIQVCLQMV